MLEVRGLSIVWQGATLLQDVEVTVRPGEIVALTGANGSGKSALMHTIAGLAPPHRGQVLWDGRDVSRQAFHKREGIAFAPEGRMLAPTLTVLETLKLGAGRVGRAKTKAQLDRVVERFPILRHRLDQPAGTLSGGEAQMLSLSRALMSAPRLLVLDEPTLGLSPAAAAEAFATLDALRSDGMAILLSDQDWLAVSELADRTFTISDNHLFPNSQSKQKGAIA